jgi:hypothetical protein
VSKLSLELVKAWLSKTVGQFLMTQVTVPPMLSSMSLYFATKSSIRFVTSACGHLTGRNSSTFFRVTVSMSFRYSGFVVGVGCSAVGGKRNSLPMEAVQATISMPYASRRYFSAIAPAATRPLHR